MDDKYTTIIGAAIMMTILIISMGIGEWLTKKIRPESPIAITTYLILAVLLIIVSLTIKKPSANEGLETEEDDM